MLFPCSAQIEVWYEAARNLHRAMWQNDIEKKLLDVVGYKGLKYLPLTEVKNLQLGELGCTENPILFREDYSFTLKQLKDRRSNHDFGGMVVLGHPGIGTSLL